MPLVTIKVFEEELSESQSRDLKGYGSNYPDPPRKAFCRPNPAHRDLRLW